MEKLQKMSLLLAGLMLLTLTATIVGAQMPYGPGSDEAAFFMGLGLTMCLIILIVPLIIAILLCIWIYKDAEKRGKSGAIWVLILILATIFLNLLGLIIVIVIWLIVRPPIQGSQTTINQTIQTGSQQSSERRCPGCGRVIPDDAQVCPYCGKQF